MFWDRHKPIIRARLSTFTVYLLGAVLSLLILCWAMKLWKADLAVPFNYFGDALVYGIVIKGTIENGWYLHNDSLGAPGGLRMNDFPIPDGFNFLIIKALALIRPEYGWVLNVFFLLTFPLITLTSLFAFLELKLSRVAALVASLLYTFIPFHFIRGEGHFFLSTYYLVPLAITVALWLSLGKLSSLNDGKPRLKSVLRSRRFVFSAIVCLLTSSVGYGYYAFFSSFFILFAGITAVIAYRTVQPLIVSLILCGVIFVGLLANLAPNLIYLAKHGDVNVAQRQPGEAEYFGLKITQMLLPMRMHRVPMFARIGEKYMSFPLVNENITSTLGLVGATGFLILVVWFLFLKPDAINLNSVISHVSLMNMAAVFLGIVGGFSALFALFVSPQIRTYNRLSIFISFFSILTVVVLLENLYRKLSRTRAIAVAYRGLLVVILTIGLLDQTSPAFVPNYDHNKVDFNNDEEFVSKIQSLMPPGSMIFQMPYVPFPEYATVYEMGDYALFRGYLHSKTLRWSYGTIKGRDGDLWLRDVSSRKLPEMLPMIALAGFGGIYIDRLGFADRAAGVESELSRLLNTTPFISTNKQLVFFDMTDFVTKLQQKYSPEQWALKRQHALNPLTLSWTNGFSDLEGSGENSWRWSSYNGELWIKNPLGHDRRLNLEMELSSGYAEFANMNIASSAFSDWLRVNNQGVRYSKSMTVPPGTFIIRLSCEARRVGAPRDERTLVFKVMKLNWSEID
jgi:hypothetical protein